MWQTKREHSWPVVKEFLEQHSGSLVDVGCGTGRDLELAKELGYNPLLGIDIAQGQLDIVKEKGFDTFTGNIEEIYLDKQFDVVLSIASLHHCEHPKKALANMKKLLNAQGIALISTWMPGKEYLEQQEKSGKLIWQDEKWAKITFEGEPRYYYFFEEQEFIDLVGEYFSVVEIQYDNNNLYTIVTL